MKRAELEHLIRAVSALVRDQELYVLGSQAILGAYPRAPAELLRSLEADLYPKNKPAGAILIDDALGERSAFHSTYGYCAHAVAPEVTTLPDGWEQRLIPVKNENTGQATGWCLEPHDLAASKLAAKRQKDLAFVARLIRHKLVRVRVLCERLARTPLSRPRQRALVAWVKRVR